MGEVTPSKKWEEEVSRRYAALNLAALHSQFDHKWGLDLITREYLVEG